MDDTVENNSHFAGYQDSFVTVNAVQRNLEIHNMRFRNKGRKVIAFDEIKCMKRLAKSTIWNTKVYGWSLDGTEWAPDWSRYLYTQKRILVVVSVKERFWGFELRYGFTIERWEDFKETMDNCLPGMLEEG